VVFTDTSTSQCVRVWVFGCVRWEVVVCVRVCVWEEGCVVCVGCVCVVCVGYRVQSIECTVHSTEYSTEYRVQSAEYRVV
jgi:hypothetical protein